MAQDPRDREDLLRDATQYVSRMEFRLVGGDVELFCGFRAAGAWSLYWGQDQVVQFNAAGKLRRAFWQERLLASYQHRLHWLHRRDSARAMLTREPLATEEQAAFLSIWDQRLTSLQAALADAHQFQILGSVPDDDDVLAQTEAWLRHHPPPIELARHPGVGRE